MESFKNIYKKVMADKNASKQEMDQLCLNLKAVQQINISKKSQKDKVELIGRLVPNVKKVMKGQEEDAFLLNDLVRQWVIDTTEICIKHLNKLGVKSLEQKKEYMNKILGPRYIPNKDMVQSPISTPNLNKIQRKSSTSSLNKSKSSSTSSIRTIVRASKDKRQ